MAYMHTAFRHFIRCCQNLKDCRDSEDCTGVSIYISAVSPLQRHTGKNAINVQYIGLESISVSPGRSPGHQFTNLCRFRRKKGIRDAQKLVRGVDGLSLEVCTGPFFGPGPARPSLSPARPGPFS
jgi:hypothetical protein